MIPPPPRSTLFPYTTLFRSHHCSWCFVDGPRLIRHRRALAPVLLVLGVHDLAHALLRVLVGDFTRVAGDEDRAQLAPVGSRFDEEGTARVLAQPGDLLGPCRCAEVHPFIEGDEPHR